MFPVWFIQLAVVLTSCVLVLFIADYTYLTRGANWKDPIGLTLTLEALLLIPNMVVALFRWFGPLTPGWLSWEIDVQSMTLFLLGLIMGWRIIVFNLESAQIRARARSSPIKKDS